MKSLLAAFVLALILGVLLTQLVSRIALARGVVARAGARHIHAGNIPRVGGIAMALAWALALLAFLPLQGLGSETLARAKTQLFAILGGALLLCAVGALDDIRGLRIRYKLGAQVVAAVVAFSCGIRIEAISLPFFGVQSMGVFALPVTVLWIVGITNAVNLIDGLDGLAAGVGLFAAVTGLVVAMVHGGMLVALSFSALIGTLVGFLFFNFNPARVFMGDSGSYFLGYVLATASLAASIQQKASTAVTLLVPIVALGLPIFDTLFSMVRRFIDKRPIMAPDRGHTHHRLLELGLTHRRAVMLLYAVSVLFAGCAILMNIGGNWITGSALLVASLVLIALMRFTGYFDYLHKRGRQAARIYDGVTERLRRAMPELLKSFHGARHEHEALDLLERVAGDAGCSAVELRSGGQLVQRFPAGAKEPVAAVRRTYPIGPDRYARAELHFMWHVDEGDPNAQITILMQLVVDGVAVVFERCNSPLAAVPEPEPVSSEPAIVPVGIVPGSHRA